MPRVTDPVLIKEACDKMTVDMENAISNSTKPGLIIIGAPGSGKYYILSNILKSQGKEYLEINDNSEMKGYSTFDSKPDFIGSGIGYLVLANQMKNYLIVWNVEKILGNGILTRDLINIIDANTCKKIFFLSENLQNIPDWCKNKSDVYFHNNSS